MRDRTEAPVAVADDSASAELELLAELEAHAGRLREGRSPAREADELARAARALSAGFPGERTARRIAALLEERALASVPGSDGQPLRRALVEAQAALGFPWALEIEPDDLALLPREPERFLPQAVLTGSYVLLGLTAALLFAGVCAMLAVSLMRAPIGLGG